MEDQCVVAEYANYKKARIGLEVLDMRGFADDTVSVISSSSNAEVAELERARREKNAEASVTASGGLGAAVASGAAAPLAAGTMLAPFFIVGPIAAALAGAAAGGLLSGARKWGVSEDASETYQKRLEEGSVLVVVHATGDRLEEAASGLRTTDTLSLATYAANFPDDEVDEEEDDEV
jgi:hypothetical protein